MQDFNHNYTGPNPVSSQRQEGGKGFFHTILSTLEAGRLPQVPGELEVSPHEGQECATSEATSKQKAEHQRINA